MARTGGRNAWIAWPAGLLCAAVVVSLAWLAQPMVPVSVAWVGDMLRAATHRRRRSPRRGDRRRARARPGRHRLPRAVPRPALGRAHLDAGRAAVAGRGAARRPRSPRSPMPWPRRCGSRATGAPTTGARSSRPSPGWPPMPARSPKRRCAGRASPAPGRRCGACARAPPATSWRSTRSAAGCGSRASRRAWHPEAYGARLAAHVWG